MDSASKAIVIAGGILIGVLVISISMYMLATFRDLYQGSMDEFEAQQIASFNSFFTQYGSTIKGYDVYNIIGKINEVNADQGTNYFIHFTSNGEIKRETTFYYTENFSKDYNYSYDYDPDGVIYRITINDPDVVVEET